LAVCFLLALNIYPEKAQILTDAVKTFKPRGNRSMFIEKNNKKIFMDAYNANMDSMLVSLKGYMDYLKQSGLSINDALYIVGDMNELGAYTEQYHKKIGTFLKDQKLELENVVFVGRFFEHYRAGFGAPCTSFSTKAELEKNWAKISRPFQHIFLKASRSLQLESLLDIT
jgi:UDP-N-acetylmuramoyl-tripeptide--D-alanyl-D-alanine ligase